MAQITSLSAETIQKVKATIPALDEKRLEVVQDFYLTLFEKFPKTAAFFNRENAVKDGETLSTEEKVPPQVTKLGNAILNYARHIEDLSPLLPRLTQVCHKHVSRNVKSVHYKLIGQCLLESIGRILGPDVVTDDVLEAWKEAFWYLANKMIQIEAQLRKDGADGTRGGYEGYKEMRVDKVITHGNSAARTFFLATTDESLVPAHRGGQYVSFDVKDIPGVGAGKTSAMLLKVSDHYLAFTIYHGDDKTSSHILQTVREGDVMSVSIPCGSFALPEAVRGVPSAVLVGAGTDAAMLCAIAQDLQSKGAKHVTLVIPDGEHIGIPDDLKADVAIEKVGAIHAVDVDRVLQACEAPSVLILAPSAADLRHTLNRGMTLVVA